MAKHRPDKRKKKNRLPAVIGIVTVLLVAGAAARRNAARQQHSGCGQC